MARTKLNANQSLIAVPHAVDASGNLAIDLSSLGGVTITDPSAFQILLQSLIDGSLKKLTLSSLPPIIPYNSWSWFFEDFLNNSAFVGGLAQSVSGGTLTVGTGDQSVPGVLNLNTGAVATNRAGVATGATSLRFGGGKMTYEARVKVSALSNGTDTYTVYAGYGDNSAGVPVDGAFFRYTHGTNSGFWQAATRVNNVETAVNFSVAPSTSGWQKLNVSVYADGSRVDFTLTDTNGAQTTLSSTTNIPTAAGRETGIVAQIVKSVGTTSVSFLLDYIYHLANLTTAR